MTPHHQDTLVSAPGLKLPALVLTALWVLPRPRPLVVKASVELIPV